MGLYFVDQYSLLHFAAGIVAYFFYIPLTTWILIHIIFEYIENTKVGIYISNNFFPFWPGSKRCPDSFINSSLGDNFFAILGWIVAYYVGKMGKSQALCRSSWQRHNLKGDNFKKK